MATHAMKTPFIRAVTNRSYSSQGKYLPICGTITDVKTTVLPNKLVVASAENGSPIARLSIVLRAGSRYENGNEFGVAHTLRNAAGLSTKNYTRFAIIRNIQQVGANLTCTTDRETIAYTLEGTYEGVECGSEFLSDIVSQQVFKPWELDDLTPRIKLELATRLPQVKAIDLLHKVAFRTGLGNSLYCPKHNVGRISPETLQHYVCTNFKTNRAAVLGVGVNHEELVKYAQNLCLESGEGSQKSPSSIAGGEIRKDKGGDIAYVAIGTQGAALTNEKEALAFAVLKRVFGVGPYTKRGNESSGILYKAIAQHAADQPVSISALNVSYSDAGLFGFLVAAHVDNACETITNAVKVFKAGNVSDEDVNRAKNQLKTSVLLENESGRNYIQVMGNQAVHLGTVQTPEELVKAIDNVTVADVKQAAQKIKSGKLAMASVGNLTRVPYLDQLE